MLEVKAGPCSRTNEGGAWWALWRLRATDEPLQVLEAWLPHDHFHRPRWRFNPPLVVEDTVLEAEVSCEDRPGSVIENAFLILRTPEQRFFARLTVVVDGDGVPHQRCESVTVQEV